MQRLVFLLSIFFVFSCSQEKPEAVNTQSTENREARIWHQTDTLFSAVKWNSDSLRQIKLELNKLSDPRLEAKSDAPIYLFFGDQLMEKSQDGYLKYSFGGVAPENVLLSLDGNVQKLTYGIYTIEKVAGKEPYSSIEVAERDSLWISDNILIILLLGASLFMAIIKLNYDKRYLHILSFSKIFTTRLNEGDQSRVRIMDRDNLVFAGFYSFLTAGLIYFLIMGKNIAFLGVPADGIVEFLKILALVAVGLIAKVILISVASNLFGNNKIPAFYVKEMLNINLFFVIILFFSSFLIFLFEGFISALWVSAALYALLVFYLIRLILLYFKILKLSSFTNLYLFSYFCTTEIFPFLIGLKYFIR